MEGGEIIGLGISHITLYFICTLQGQQSVGAHNFSSYIYILQGHQLHRQLQPVTER